MSAVREELLNSKIIRRKYGGLRAISYELADLMVLYLNKWYSTTIKRETNVFANLFSGFAVSDSISLTVFAAFL